MQTFRAAQPSEAALLSSIALSAKSYWGYPSQWLELWKPELTISPDQIAKHHFIVAEVGGAVAGFTAVAVEGTQSELEHLWVLPEFMKRSIGQSLFQRALCWSRRKGCCCLRVVSDPGALPFYQAMGGTIIGEQHSIPEPRMLPILEFERNAS